MEQSQGEILPNLLIDACGWAAVVDSRMNIDLEINRTIGPSRWILPNQVKLELEKMGEQRTDLLLDLLFSRAEIITKNSPTKPLVEGSPQLAIAKKTKKAEKIGILLTTPPYSLISLECNLSYKTPIQKNKAPEMKPCEII